MKQLRNVLFAGLLVALLVAGVVQESTQAAGSVNYTFYCDALVVSGTTDHDHVIADVIVRWSGFPGTSRAKMTMSPPGSGLRSFNMVVPISPTLTNPAPAPFGPLDPDNKEQYLHIAGYDNGQDPYFGGETYYQAGTICDGLYYKGPGCDMQPIPATAVGGSFVADAPLYYMPGDLVEPATSIAAGNTAWVLGKDASGQYYKILWSCDQLWVPVSSMGPNYDAVWNGTPLPTGVVE